MLKLVKMIIADVKNIKNKDKKTIVKFTLLLLLSIKYGWLLLAYYSIRLVIFYNMKKHWNSKIDENLKVYDYKFNSLKQFEITFKSKTPFSSVDKSKLEHGINATLVKMVEHDVKKNRFTVNFNRGKIYKYTKLEKGSLERLEAVLILMTRNIENVKYLKSYENESETVHEFVTNIAPKTMTRQLSNIEHKTGLLINSLNITQNNGVYSFSIKKQNEKMYLLDDHIMTSSKNTKMQLPFILGVNYKTGSVVIKDLIEVLHLLIAGKTGSGKSVTFKCIIESLMYWNQNISFYMLDFAESALTRYENFANVKYVESNFDSIQNSIKELRCEMHKRMKEFRHKNIENIKEYNDISKKNIPYIVFAIDEANGFKEEMSKKEFEEIVNEVKALLKRGRKYGIILLFAVQQTNDNDFCKSWRTQCTRLGHLLSDHVDCQNLTTNKEVGQLLPHLRPGEFYLVQEGKEIVKMKGCFTSKNYNKLFKVLEEVYSDEKVVETIEIEEKEENQTIRQENTTSDTNKNTSIA